MEWVETTGDTIDEARLRALDTLGVAYDDAEVEILTEPKKGLFGIGRTEARVRARVRPVQPRPKAERRDRGRRKGGGGDRGDRGGRRSRGGKNRSGGGGNKRSDSKGDAGEGSSGSSGQKKNSRGGGDRSGGRSSDAVASGENKSDGAKSSPKNKGGEGRGDAGRSKKPTDGGSDAADKRAKAATDREQKSMDSEEVVDAAGQAAMVEEFLDGLLDAFGASGDTESVALDDETYEVRVNGSDLGLLIGPKGQTMQAIQEVARTAVQQRTDGSLTGRVHLDVGGYRSKRREALAEFTRRVAAAVVESGDRKVLEPMPAPDRKVIHDVVAEIDGVESSSEGEDNRRHVVISPTD